MAPSSSLHAALAGDSRDEVAAAWHREPPQLLKELAGLGISNQSQLTSLSDAQLRELVSKIGWAHRDILNMFRGEFSAFSLFQLLLQAPRRLSAPQLHIALAVPAAASRRAGPPPRETLGSLAKRAMGDGTSELRATR